MACAAPKGTVASNDDCDDLLADVNPSAAEVCNGYDDDCDELVDAADPEITGLVPTYTDADGDGYGVDGTEVLACPGGAEVGGDCNDDSDVIFPDADEICGNDVDEDCDDVADDGCCADIRVIEYADSYATTPLETGAALLGATVSVHRDGASFGAAAAGDTWDIVVVDVPGGSLPSQVSSHIESTITDGGKVMFSWWGLATDGPLQAVLGVQNATSYSNPRGFSSSDATTLFSAPESVPDPFVTPSHDAGINGQSLTAVDADTSTTLASYSDAPTEPAILATYDGQVLINTFLPWDWKSTDDDADGTSDMAELYANELVWMTGCTP